MKQFTFFKLTIIFIFIFVTYGQVSAQAGHNVLARVEVKASLDGLGLPVYAHLKDARGEEYALVITSISKLDELNKDYVIIDIIDPETNDEFYFIALERIDGARQKASRSFHILYDDGKQIVVRTTPKEAEALTLMGLDIELLNPEPMVLKKSVAAKPLSSNYNSIIAEIINKVNQDTLYGYVANLSGECEVNIEGSPYRITTRYTNSGTPIQKATQYVYEFMQNLGLNVSFHDWSSWYSNRNVVGTKIGTTKPQEIVLITGHLDCVPSGTGPGADDNASGSVGVMVAAQILSQYQFERTIRFVFFTGEEQGLYGSKAYASKVYEDGDNIVAVYNMDMISWDKIGSPTLRLHLRTTGNPGYSADKAIADVFVGIVNTYSLNLTPIFDPDGCPYSDHASLWNKGYAGILAIEDDEDDFCANYHTSSDKISTLNMAYFTQYVKASIGTIGSLALPVSK